MRPSLVCTLLALCLVALLGATAAHARHFVVDVPRDAVDATPGDGRCATAAGDCTLRAAVNEANASPGLDFIRIDPRALQLDLEPEEPFEDEDDDRVGDLDIRSEVVLYAARSRRARSSVRSGNFRHFDVHDGSRLGVFSLILEGGRTGEPGGGAVRVERGGKALVSDTVLRENRGFLGGAISNHGDLIVRRSLFHDNDAGGENGTAIFNRGSLRVEHTIIAERGGEDGAISSENFCNFGKVVIVDSLIDGHYGEDPGGILNGSGGDMTILRSTISNNRGDEGGILNEGTLKIFDSTVSGNSGLFGGGIVNDGVLLMVNSTVTDNFGVYVAGGLYNTGIAMVQSSLIAGNFTDENENLAPDCSGEVSSLGNNLVGDATGCGGFGDATDRVGSRLEPVDARLGPLEDNGGPTPTHALLRGSPAIDAIHPSDCSFDHDLNPDTPEERMKSDQRGKPRRGHCDIGAFEAHRGRSHWGNREGGGSGHRGRWGGRPRAARWR